MGTPGYIAPEILDNSMCYTEKVDIWSTGIITFMLLTEDMFLKGRNEKIRQLETVSEQYVLNRINQK